MKRWKWMSLILGVLIAVVVCSPIQASEPFYDKGRAESTVLGGKDVGRGTLVLSAAAFYDRAGQWGRERIRMWGRHDAVQQLYPSPRFSVSGMSWVNLRFFVDCGNEPRCEALMIDSTHPGASGDTFPWWSAIAYDILGYKGIPTMVIEAFINGLSAKTAVERPQGFDATVRLDAGLYDTLPAEKSDLPTNISYTEADGAVSGTNSGLSAKFQYHLPVENVNFRVWPQGIAAYLIWQQVCAPAGSCGWYPFHLQTGPIGVQHTLNTR